MRQDCGSPVSISERSSGAATWESSRRQMTDQCDMLGMSSIES
jgi:hypothetical protein